MFGRPLILLLLTLLAASGCGSDSTSAQVETESAMQFELPIVIRESLAVDFNRVTGEVIINGRLENMERFDNNRFRAELPNIPANSDVTISVQFTEELPDGQDLLLALTDPRTFFIGGSDQTIEITSDQYNFPDTDNDQISNIAERNNNTNPFVSENAGTRRITVQFNLPLIIQNPILTQVTGLINDITRARTRMGNFFEVTGVVVAGSVVDIDMRLSQQFTNAQGQNVRVPIASGIRMIAAGNDDEIIVLSDGDFNFNIDSDGDGVLNLDELEAGTDPNIAN